jgi:hypothetical protein
LYQQPGFELFICLEVGTDGLGDLLLPVDHLLPFPKSAVGRLYLGKECGGL